MSINIFLTNQKYGIVVKAVAHCEKRENWATIDLAPRTKDGYGKHAYSTELFVDEQTIRDLVEQLNKVIEKFDDNPAE